MIASVTTTPDGELATTTSLDIDLRLGGVPHAQVLRRARRVFAAARTTGDDAVGPAIVVGLSAFQAGLYREAVDALGYAIEHGRLDVHDRPDIYTTLGRAHDADGHPELAVDLFERVLEQLDPVADPDAYARFAAYESCARADLGDLGGAAEAQARARAAAALSHDPYTQIRVEWTGARLADDRGDVTAARVGMCHVILMLSRTEDLHQLGRAHLLAGQFALADGDLDDAEGNLDLAEVTLGDEISTQDKAVLLADRARLLVARGDYAEAASLARSAIAILGSGEPGEQGRARWALGEALAGDGDLDGALREFEKADRLLARSLRHTSKMRVAWAAALDQAGRAEEAASLRRRVAAIVEVRRLRRPLAQLVSEIEAAQVVQRAALDDLECRVAAAERSLGVPSDPRGRLRLLPQDE